MAILTTTIRGQNSSTMTSSPRPTLKKKVQWPSRSHPLPTKPGWTELFCPTPQAYKCPTPGTRDLAVRVGLFSCTSVSPRLCHALLSGHRCVNVPHLVTSPPSTPVTFTCSFLYECRFLLPFFFFGRSMHRSEIAGSCGTWIFTFVRNCTLVSKSVASFHISVNNGRHI